MVDAELHVGMEAKCQCLRILEEIHQTGYVVRTFKSTMFKNLISLVVQALPVGSLPNGGRGEKALTLDPH